MSSKIGKRQQKRSRFDASGVVVTGAFTRDVSTLPETCSTSGSDEKTDYNLESSVIDAAMQFKHLFQTFTTLSSTADELKILTETIQVLEVMAAGGKTVSSPDGNDGKKESSKTKTQSPAKFDDATVDPIAQFKVCLSVLFGVLFLPNSRPLHRTIVASPRRFPLVAKRMAETILGDAIHEKIRATLSSGETSTSGTKTMTDSSGQGASTLRVLGVLFSVVQCQPQTAVEKRIVRRVAVEAAALIGKGVQLMLTESAAGRRIPPAEMETCQEAMSVAYALIVRHPDLFFPTLIGHTEQDLSNEDTDYLSVDVSHPSLTPSRVPSESSISQLVLSLTETLQGSYLSREAGVSAGVTVAAAVGCGVSDPTTHAAALADAFFSDAPTNKTWASVNGVDDSFLDSLALSGEKTCMKSEAKNFTLFGRLSAVRGLLTAASADALSALLVRPNVESKNRDWSLLTDGCLPLLCLSLENSKDSHHKFHAAAALKSALVRIKALATSGSNDELNQGTDSNQSHLSVDTLLPKNVSNRISSILWANWEDPLSQTVKEIHLSFDCLLDIEDKRDGGSVSFLLDAANALLQKEASSKGRYVPLAFVVRRLGFHKLNRIAPDILKQTINAMRDESISTAAGNLVHALSASLLSELSSAEGGVNNSENSYMKRVGKDELVVDCGLSVESVTKWRDWWIPEITEALLSKGRERVGASVYALPNLLKQDGASVIALLDTIVRSVIGTSSSHSSAASAVVAVLKSARSLGLLSLNDVNIVNKKTTLAATRTFEFINQEPSKEPSGYTIDPSWLYAASTCKDPRARCDALELLCLDGKRASLPGSLELEILKQTIVVNLRDSNAAFRNSLVSNVTRLLGRIRTGLSKAAVISTARPWLVPSENNSMNKQSDSTRGQRCFGAHAKGVRAIDDDEAFLLLEKGRLNVSWMQCLIRTLVTSSYPGAPYERKQTSLDLLQAVAATWEVGKETTCSLPPSSEWVSSQGPHMALAERFESSPYAACLGPDVVTCLLGSVVDSWDKLRVGAFTLLTKHPAPLAGVETSEQVEAHVQWAMTLSRSPRVRESDAAALLLRLLLRKYALDGGWEIILVPNIKATPPSQNVDEKNKSARAARSAKLLETMCDLIAFECEKAEADLFKACMQSLAHGALLATRYVLAEIDFSSTFISGSDCLPIEHIMERLLQLLERVTNVALTSISAPDGANIGAAASDITLDTQGGGSGQGAAAAKAASRAMNGMTGVGGTTAGDDAMSAVDDDTEHVEGGGSDSNTPSLAPKAQMIVTACWLTMKEISLVIGEIARRVPLPGGDGSRSVSLSGDDVDASHDMEQGLLNPDQLKRAGDRLLSTLLTLKHNGAIEKTLVGLTCLGERVLRSGNNLLSSLPSNWLGELFTRLEQPAQSIKDLIRRSAGIPFGFMAVFLAEPRGVPRVLLHSAMEKLLRIASDDGEFVRRGDVALGQSQGVHVPQVHAFNVLRVAFADKELATETVGFAADGFVCAIKAFSSPHWEVRNGATLTFASLLTKVVGYMNVVNPKDGGASRRAVAGDEFFKRFPSTHPFLLRQLTEAADLFDQSNGKEVHPALYPILSLLSRLRPSSGAPSGAGVDEGLIDPAPDFATQSQLDPSFFIPVVRRCTAGKVHAVRAQAARALAPLVRPEDTPIALHETFKDTEGINSKITQRIFPRTGYNAAHGCLLCVAEILGVDGPVRAAKSAETQASAVFTAAKGLTDCAYLVDPSVSNVAATAAAWACCAHNALEVARSVRERYGGDTHNSDFFLASNRLTRLAVAACDISASIEGFVSGSGGGDAAVQASKAGASVSVADVEWFKRAARLRCVIALDEEGFGEDEDADDFELKDALHFEELDCVNTSDSKDSKRVQQRNSHLAFLSVVSPSVPYEARASGLKTLRDAGVERVQKSLGPTRFKKLRTFLLQKVLPVEKRHQCARRLLQVLEQWTGVDETNIETDSHTQEYESSLQLLVCLASSDPNERVRCAAIKCLGKFFSESASGNTNQRSVLYEQLVALILAGCSPERPLDVRRAVAQALAHSKILECLPQGVDDADNSSDMNTPTSGPVLGELVLRAWRAAFELMEDEDELTRDIVAHAAACAVGIDANAQTEQRLRLSFDRVSTRLKRWPPFTKTLSRYISNAFWDDDGEDNVTTSMNKTLNASISETRVVRRLFDREADNHHCEGLLLAQLSARVIRDVRGVITQEEAKVNLINAAHAVVAASQTLARLIAHMNQNDDSSPDWAGGATNHPSGFAPLNRACLSVWAFSVPAGEGARQEAKKKLEKNRVSENFEKAGLGPAAAAAWGAARKSLLEGEETYIENTRASAFHEFDPCFLLR